MKYTNRFSTGLIPLTSSFLLIAASAVLAQQPAEQTIVTGNYHPLTATQISSSVSVIDRETIVHLNKTNLADLLESVPGVSIERQGGPGGLAVASIRGGESNYTLVMIDGVALNDPGNSRGGAFDLGNINVESIERIEIVKGPQSAIYGADALAGVINIISLRPQQGHQQTLSASAGDAGFHQAGLSAMGATDTLDYSLQLRARDSGEPIEGSTAKDKEINLRAGWKPSSAHQVSASFRYFDGEHSSFPEQSGGPEFALSSDLDHTDFTDKSSALGWQYQVAEQWKSHLQATLYQRSETFRSPGIVPFNFIPPNGADTDFERQQISWINTLGKQGDFWANVGVEQRREDGTSKGYLDFGFLMPTDFSLDRTTQSGFLDANGQVTDDLLLQASIRNDKTDGFGNKTSSKAGLRYQVTDQLTFRTSAGSGYKLPSFYALGHPLVGNADLKPETVNSWDASIEWQVTEQWSSSINYFDNAYRDLIVFDSELFTNVNREEVRSSGAEWQAQWHSIDNQVSLVANATYIDIDVKGNESVLTGRPQWQAGLDLVWHFNEGWYCSLNYQSLGEQFATSQHTGATTLQELDAYQRLDATLFWSLSDSLSIHFALDNALDNQGSTAIGFPIPERLWRIGARWTLGQ